MHAQAIDSNSARNCRLANRSGPENSGQGPLAAVTSDKPARKASLPKPYGEDGS